MVGGRKLGELGSGKDLERVRGGEIWSKYIVWKLNNQTRTRGDSQRGRTSLPGTSSTSKGRDSEVQWVLSPSQPSVLRYCRTADSGVNHRSCALVSCCSKAPQVAWLQWQSLIFSRFWGLEVHPTLKLELVSPEVLSLSPCVFTWSPSVCVLSILFLSWFLFFWGGEPEFPLLDS